MTAVARRIAALLVAASLVVGASPVLAGTRPADAGATTADTGTTVKAVTWKVDHAARTITATVRIQLGSKCTRAEYSHLANQGSGWRRCLLDQRIVDTIKAQIDAAWNTGLKYRCYTLKVVADITVLNELDGPAEQTKKAPSDRIHIAIDQTPATARSNVNTTESPGRWNGRATSDAIAPQNDPGNPSTWRYPPTGSRGLYAHELGHVMGLDDGYEDVVKVGPDGKEHIVSEYRSDAPHNDLMSDDDVTTVDPSTVTVLVERAGIRTSDLQCDYTVDQTTSMGRISGTKCGGVEGTWTVKTDMKNDIAKVKQTFVIKKAQGSLKGTFTYTDAGSTKSYGSTTTSKARSSGDAVLILGEDGTATWILTEKMHRQSGTATAAGRTIRVPETDAPLVTWTWEWKPVDCAK